jgi:hypothetical protein
VLYDEKLPEDFLLKTIECNKTGTGYPAWMNIRPPSMGWRGPASSWI